MTKTLKILLIIFIAVVLVAVGVIYWQSKQKSESKTETLSWQTYQNKNLGFTFSYPNSWELDVTEESEGTSFNATVYPKDIGVEYYIEVAHSLLNEDNKDINTQFDKLEQGCHQDAGCTVLSDKKAVKSKSFTAGSTEEISYFFATGKYVIEFVYTYNNENFKNRWEQDRAVFESVVNSFQIIK